MILAIVALIFNTSALAAPHEASVTSQETPLTLQQALVMAEDYSPDLKAAQARALQAENQIVLSKSNLYPSLQGQAGTGYGFLGGSNSLLDLDQMVVNREDHIGPMGGFTSSLEVFNASTYMTIALAKKNLDYYRALVALTRYQVDLAAARAYFEASRDLGSAAAWKTVGHEMQDLYSDVNSLVRSGYQNPVDVLLVKDQVTQAQIEQKAFEARYRASLNALGALIGKEGTALSCPAPLTLSESFVDVFASGTSPYLQIGQSQVKVAKATVSQTKAENYPVIRAMGAVDIGRSDGEYLSADRNYALGLGVGIPIFEGFRLVEQKKQAENLLGQRQFDLSAADEQIKVQSAEFDKAIDSDRIEVTGLAPEYEDDQRVLHLARERYRNFQGRLVDVREALRDLARVGLAQNDAMADLLYSLAGKSLLNGGMVRRSP